MLWSTSDVSALTLRLLLIGGFLLVWVGIVAIAGAFKRLTRKPTHDMIGAPRPVSGEPPPRAPASTEPFDTATRFARRSTPKAWPARHPAATALWHDEWRAHRRAGRRPGR